MIKRLITWLYERYGKEPEHTVVGSFSNIPMKGNVLPLNPTQIYESAGIWERVYKEELAKPQWICEDSEYGKKRNELRARRAADIAVGNVVWTIK